MAAIYSTMQGEGVDVNSVFMLDARTAPEYPNPPFLPGTMCFGTDGSAWTFATASITIAKGSVVLFSAVPGSWSVALIGGATVATAPTGRLVGVVGGSTGTMVVPAPSGTQTGGYFWCQVKGNVPNVASLASTTANVQLYDSATTGGAVTVTAGGPGTSYQINGLWISQATGSAAGPNTAIANWPVVGSSL
jgi:hypothetical protein